jgi:hypothetical protein
MGAKCKSCRGGGGEGRGDGDGLGNEMVVRQAVEGPGWAGLGWAKFEWAWKKGTITQRVWYGGGGGGGGGVCGSGMG